MLIWWIAAAVAQDPLIDIPDLGSAVETMTYKGSFDQRSRSGVPADTYVKVDNRVGITIVKCEPDIDTIKATARYTLTGSEESTLEKYGKSLKIAVIDGKGVTISLTGAARPASIQSGGVELTIIVPKIAKVEVQNGADWARLTGCDGPITVNAPKSAVYASGLLPSFDITSGGDVKVVTDANAHLTASSRIRAPQGKIALIAKPSDWKIDARGSIVTIPGEISGSITTAAVQGTIGSGIIPVTLEAKDTIEVTLPQ